MGELEVIQVARRRFARQIAFIQARLSPDDYLGLQLTIGAAVLVAASWVFGGIAEDVVNGDAITLLDAQLAEWLHRHSTPPLTRFMLMVSSLNGTLAILTLTLVVGLALLWRRDWYRLLTLVLVVPGGMLINVMMKLAFHRARPSFEDPILTLSSYSFPSGHVAGATLFYGLLTAMLLAATRGWARKAALVLVFLALVLLVALSRMYLGVHYLSDVLAAFAEAVAWLTLCRVAIHTYREHRAQARRARP